MINHLFAHLPGFELGILAGMLAPLMLALGVLAWRQGPLFGATMAWVAMEATRMIAVIHGHSFESPLMVIGTLGAFLVVMLLTPRVFDNAPAKLRAAIRAGCSINALVIALIMASALIWNAHAPSLAATLYWCLAGGLMVAIFAVLYLREARGIQRLIAWTWIVGFGVMPTLLILCSRPLSHTTHSGDELWMVLCTARLLCIAVMAIALGLAREWVKRPHASPTSAPHRSAPPRPSPAAVAAPNAVRAIAQGDDLSEQLDRALRQLSHAGDMQSQMGSMMSHELRAPLSTISAAAQSLELILSGSGDLVDGRIARIRRSVGRMTDLLDTFFNPERAKSGPLTPMQQSIDLVELARMVIAAQQLEAAHKLVLDAPEPVIVWCDPSLCTVVARNLMHNAIKYSPANQAIVVQVRTHSDGQAGELAVVDRGVGIDDNDIGRIFERNYRRAAHREVKGTGIGLYLARSLCESQGGQLAVASEVGVGSRFAMILPCKKD